MLASPIRHTLTRMISICCGTALFIAMAAFFAYEMVSFRQASTQQLQTLGQAIASNSTAALAFDNSDDAATVLGALRADPNITAAALYDMQGQLFAVYPANLARTALPAQPGTEDGYRIEHWHLSGFQAVTEGSRRLGTLYVESNLDAMLGRLRMYVLTALIVAALSTLAAYLISRRLQRRLLQPIAALTETAGAVSERHDYSVRARHSGMLEFDLLTDAFNHMLTQIQESAGKLRAQLGRLSLLQHITRATGDRQDMRSIFQVVLGSLEDNLPVDFGCILIYEAATRSLSVGLVGARSHGYAAELGLTEGRDISVEDQDLSRCLAGELVHEPNVFGLDLPFARRFAGVGLQSLVAAPLVVENEVSGVVICARRNAHSFSSGECEFLKQLSEHVALSSHQASLYAALQRAYDDLRQSQMAMLQQERLRALGQMASGIAHDINNAISPVSLYTESLLEREPGLSERTRSYLGTIQQAIEDVARTVSRMREFYREREAQLTLEEVDVNRAIRQVLDLTRPRWSDQPQQRGIAIELRTELAADLPRIMGADNEIRDALTNLIFNAVDAMPEGGTLTTRSYAVDAGDGVKSVVIEVGDTGVGMDEDTRRKCLEPFYTTKGERGTGLGLAMVYGMIQRHSAQLDIESTPGRGTIMRLTFIAAESTLAATARLVAPLAEARPLRILLVDDDPMLIKSLQDTLQEDGHAIVAASGGQAGIEAFKAARQRGESFEVVITDLGMPHVDGRKVAAAIKAMSPTTPVVLLTGWGQRLIATNDTPANIDRVLSKPPRLLELRAALMELQP
jgi:signal transduction histidine kinase/ActR/RegA family two-component response regulator